MKWTNKGHELDGIASRICAFKKMVIFGAGKDGKQIYALLKNDIEIVGFIDNNLQKQRDGYCELKVYSTEEIPQIIDGETNVVIAVYDKCEVHKIIEEMENCGLKYRKNLFYMNEFLPVFMWYKKQILLSVNCTLSVTQRCNLNCKDCCIFTPYIKNPKHVNVSELKRDIDLFFNAFDYVYRFNIIGGEPFLYPDMNEIIPYIINNYENQIGKLSLTTNGTVKLSADVLETIKKYDIFLSVSDYSQALPPLKESVEKFIKNLIENEINYEILKSDDWWVDMGRGGEYFNDAPDEKMIDWFDDCAMPCHLLKNEKYYFCQDDGFAYEAGFVKEDSGFSLNEFNKNDRAILLEYSLGCCPEGYVELCRKCNGMPPKNKSYIPAAIQIDRN